MPESLMNTAQTSIRSVAMSIPTLAVGKRMQASQKSRQFLTSVAVNDVAHSQSQRSLWLGPVNKRTTTDLASQMTKERPGPLKIMTVDGLLPSLIKTIGLEMTSTSLRKIMQSHSHHACRGNNSIRMMEAPRLYSLQEWDKTMTRITVALLSSHQG
jgi:hypothetical protein